MESRACVAAFVCKFHTVYRRISEKLTLDGSREETRAGPAVQRQESNKNNKSGRTFDVLATTAISPQLFHPPRTIYRERNHRRSSGGVG